MWAGTRQRHYGYKPLGEDSPRAKVGATMFLVSARSLANVTAAGLAHQYRLTLATAEQMLAQEVARRG